MNELAKLKLQEYESIEIYLKDQLQLIKSLKAGLIQRWVVIELKDAKNVDGEVRV